MTMSGDMPLSMHASVDACPCRAECEEQAL